MSFNETNKIGKLGEERVKKHFEANTQVVDIQEMTCMGDQFAGKDLKVTFSNGFVLDVEVKTEQKDKYGNFFLEEWSNMTTGRKGWVHTCQSECIIYNFLDSPIGYAFPTNDLRRYYEQFKDKFTMKKQSKWVQTNDSWGRCANIQHVLNNTNHYIIKFKDAK